MEFDCVTERINSEKDCWWWLKDRVWSWSLNSASKLHYRLLILLHQQCYFILPLVAPISPVTRWYRICATVLDKKHRVQTGLVLSGYRASKDDNHTLFPIQHNTVREGHITQLISNVFFKKGARTFLDTCREVESVSTPSRNNPSFSWNCHSYHSLSLKIISCFLLIQKRTKLYTSTFSSLGSEPFVSGRHKYNYMLHDIDMHISNL